MKELVEARTVVAPEVSRPVTAGTSVAAQQPTEPQEVKSSYVPRWGVWLAADLSESGAWALYRERVRRFASLIGDREPVVLFRQLPAMGKAKRYIIAIVDDDRAPLDKFCEKLTAAGSTCQVMRNEFGPTDSIVTELVGDMRYRADTSTPVAKKGPGGTGACEVCKGR